MAENITVTTKKYMPPEYENRAKKLFYDVMEGRINAALMDPSDKVLLNRWLIYNLSEEERRQYNLVSPDEFDKLYPPEWEQQQPKPSPQGGTGLGEIAKEFGRGLLSELTLGLVNPPSPREHRGPLDPLAVARFLGGAVGVAPWFAAGMPWMRAGALAARAARLGPVASIVLREGVAGALHGAARSAVEQSKEHGKVDVGRTVAEGLEAGLYGAIGGRLLIARGAAGEVANRIAKKIQEHVKLFADSPAARAGKINPVEEAVNTVARQINELAQAVRSQRTTTSQEIRNKFIDLLGIDPYKNIYFASPEHAVQFLEDLASKGVKAIPKAIIPREGTGFLRRPKYAKTVVEALTKAKEPPAASTKQTTVSSLEDLLARLTETPTQTTTAAKGSKTSPATQRKIDALLKALTQTEDTPARVTPAAAPAKQAERKLPEFKGFQVSVETVPHPTSPSSANILELADYKTRLEYTNKILQKIGSDLRQIADALGVKVKDEFPGVGVYEGKINPGYQFIVEAPNAESVRAFAAAFGYLTRQESVGYHLPERIPVVVKGKVIDKPIAANELEAISRSKSLAASNAIEILTNRTLTEEDFQRVYDTIDTVLKTLGKRVPRTVTRDDFVVIPMRTGVRVLNLAEEKGIDGRKLAAIMSRVASRAFGEEAEVLPIRTAEGGLVSNNWRELSRGEAYLEELRRAAGAGGTGGGGPGPSQRGLPGSRPPDFQEWLDRIYAEKVRPVEEEYAKRLRKVAESVLGGGWEKVPEPLRPLVKALFPEAESTPPPKPTGQKPAQPTQRKKYLPPYIERSTRNLLIALPEDIKSDQEALKFGADELRKRLKELPAEVEWRIGPKMSVRATIEQIDDDGMATIRNLTTGEASRVRLVRVRADRKAVTLDSRIQNIVDEYRKVVRTPGQRAVRAREAVEVKELGGLKAGDDVYFKPEGSEDGYVAKVNSIFVSTKKSQGPSKIKVNLTVVDEHGNEIERTIVFDPNTFRESEDAALIYVTDAENRVVLWRPPKLIKPGTGGKTQRVAGKAG